MNKLQDLIKYTYDKIKVNVDANNTIVRFAAEYELFGLKYVNMWKAYPELKVIKHE